MPEGVERVQAQGASTADNLSELLERARELSALGESLAAVLSSAHGRLVFVGGEAGVGKTALVRAQWLPRAGLTVGVTGVYGPERDSTDALQRSVVSGDLTLQTGRFIVGTEVNLGREQQPPGNLTWGGGTLTAFVRLGRAVGVAARYDHLEDTDGTLTGTPQVLRSVTVGPMWFFRRAQEGIFSNIPHTTFHLPQVAVRAALRLDRSSQPFFPDANGGLDRTDTRGVVELVYLF